MKRHTLLSLLGLLGLVLLLAFTEARAQEAAPTDLAAPAITAPAADPAATLVADLAVKYPVLTTVLLVVGLLRLTVKPLIEFLRARVAATETKEDDERLDRIERSWWLRALLFALDWGASIKPLRR